MSKPRKVYKQGMEDIERVMEHLSDEFKKSQREEWIKLHYSKSKQVKPKEEGT